MTTCKYDKAADSFTVDGRPVEAWESPEVGDCLEGDGWRLQVVTDPDPECPCFGFPCVALTLCGASAYDGVKNEWHEGGDPEQLRAALDLRALDWEHGGVDYSTTRDSLRRHFERAGWSTWSGHVYCDDGELGNGAGVFVAVAPGFGSASDLAEELEEWATHGDAILALESRHDWHDDAGGTLTTWDSADVGIGGARSAGALENWRTLLDFAREFFDLDGLEADAA